MSPQINRRGFLGFSGVMGLSFLGGGASPAANGMSSKRRKTASALRKKLAEFYRELPAEPQRDNGDERRYEQEHYYASFSKGLVHDGYGEVVVDSYRSLLTALEDTRSITFDGIQLGCQPPAEKAAPKPLARVEVKPDELKEQRGQRISPENIAANNQVLLTDPQSGLAYNLQGIDSHQLAIPPCYSFRSKGQIGEIAENYWMALARDVAFAD
jgi:hypothetical protein